jgi:hypothetical protein
LVLGSTLRILEEQHPRLPATFFHLLCGALNRWVRVYDYREALEHVERLRDWYTADPDSGDIEVPDVEGSIPACMRQKPLSGRGLKRLFPNISGEALVRMERVIELDRLAKRQKHPPLTEQVPGGEGAAGVVSACVDEDRALQLELAGTTKIYVAFHVGISYLKLLSGSVAINLLAAASVSQALARTLKAARV